jgi:hypothetical protein
LSEDASVTNMRAIAAVDAAAKATAIARVGAWIALLALIVAVVALIR